MRTASFRPRLETMDPRIVPAVLFVDDDRHQRRNAQFTTIQAAVDFASPGDDIRVYAGTYREQVRVTKSNLTLEAVNGSGDRDDRGVGGAAVITPPSGGLPATGNGILVTVTGGARDVVIDGFTVRGPGVPAGSLYAGIGVGGGASALIRDNRVLDIRDPLDKTGQLSGLQSGLGILVQGADAVLVGNTVRGYQKAGIVAFGPGNVSIHDNDVTGFGPSTTIAQNGIQVSDGINAVVSDNHVSDNVYTPAGTEAAGIVVFAAGQVAVVGNKLDRNELGIAVVSQTAAPVLVARNEVERSSLDGISVQDSRNVEVRDNEVERSARWGIAVTGSSSNVLVHGNEVERSGMFDLYDDTAPVSNVVFVGNVFHTRNRPTLH